MECSARFCKVCSAETARYATGECKPCHARRAAEYRARNPEARKAADAKWREANRDKLRAYHAEWTENNPENVKKSKRAYYVANADKWKAYYEANIDRIRAYKSELYAADPAKEKQRVAEWIAANPDAVRVHSQNRRAREVGAGGKLSRGLAEKLFKLQRGLCACCKQPLGDDYQLDHIVPVARGGPNVDANIQLLRRKCNNQKRARHPIEFMQSRGFLL